MIRAPKGGAFVLFVYGTLKCGFGNHERFCRGVSNIEKALVPGELYELPFGFPALVVARDLIRATGPRDPSADAATQRRLDEPLPSLATDDSRVFGELLTFDDPEDRLPGLDQLEGFEPGGNSLYRRVLVPVQTANSNLWAWAYAIDSPAGARVSSGFWSPE
ncbi:MAG: gamma-glutamylcyclotransferase [Rubrobacteraceae bacterium]